MTSRYSLRNRNTAGADSGESNITSVNGTTAPGIQDNVNGSPRSTDVRSYSDVVASRPASPASVQVVQPVANGSGPGERVRQVDISTTSRVDSVVAAGTNADDGGGPWMVVQPRRSRSTGSLGGRNSRVQIVPAGASGPAQITRSSRTTGPARPVHTLDQEVTIALARARLTEEQEQLLHNRQRAIVVDASDTSSDTTELPMNTKGKGPDPRNWGNVELPAEELDVNRQREALEVWAQTHQVNLAQPSHNPPSMNTSGSRVTPLEGVSQGKTLPVSARNSLEPVVHLPLNSYLGAALMNVANSVPSDTRDTAPHPSLRSSDIPASLRNGQNSLIKPIAPRDYDGSPDARSYHRFITEGTDYVETGRVEPRRCVFVLSRFLKGRAYDFYTQKVAMTAGDWDLQRFFVEMFTYCFPVNYQTKQREKLRRSYQRDKSVTEYCYDLEELYNMIGTVSEREKVVKLWNGLRPSIQKALWRDGLNPEKSSWIN
ncbi:hypothetical protein DXG01_010993, partial [Tephrocybe rancida]